MIPTTNTDDKKREDELWVAILSTEHGKELKEIWIRRMTRTKSFPPELPESHCRYVAGRHSVYIDAIRAMEKSK